MSTLLSVDAQEVGLSLVPRDERSSVNLGALGCTATYGCTGRDMYSTAVVWTRYPCELPCTSLRPWLDFQMGMGEDVHA